jgi:hypothetical protein
MAKKGDWVLLRSVILQAGERAPQVPEDTAKVPLMQWVKGHRQEDAEIGSLGQARTRTGRLVTGILQEVNPAYAHSFGSFIPELMEAQDSIKKAMWGGEETQ